MASSSKSHQGHQELPRNIACAIGLRARQMEQPAALLLVASSHALVAFRRKGPGQLKVLAARWSESEGRCTVQTGPAVHLTLSDDPEAAPNQGLVDCLDGWVHLSDAQRVYRVLLNCGTLDALLANQHEGRVLASPESHSHLFPSCISGKPWPTFEHVTWAQRIVALSSSLP